MAIWNQGNTSIKKDQILKPIVISTQNNAPILEATIRNSTREEITNLKLNSDEFQNGRLTVSWNILEHNDGGTIQIVYAGDSQISLNFEGVIEGQNEIVSSNEDSNSKSIFHINTKPYWYYYLLIIFYISIGVFALDRPIKFMKRDILERDYRGVFLLSILMLVSLIMLTIAGLFIYNLFFSNNFTPPFELS